MIGHCDVLVRVDGFTLLTDPQFSTHAGPFGRHRHARACGRRASSRASCRGSTRSSSATTTTTTSTPTCAAAAQRPDVRRPLGLGAARRRASAGRRAGLVAVAESIGADSRPAQHWSAAGCPTARDAVGRLRGRRSPTRRFYFAGDTGYGSCFARSRGALGALDLALLPIGAYEPRWFMQPST